MNQITHSGLSNYMGRQSPPFASPLGHNSNFPSTTASKSNSAFNTTQQGIPKSPRPPYSKLDADLTQIEKELLYMRKLEDTLNVCASLQGMEENAPNLWKHIMRYKE